MIPATQQRNMQSSGVTARAEFGISRADEAHLMRILRDTLYTDKVLAVMREYGANAWDANREAGRGDTPILVHVPTQTEPTFSIRDYGLGLSQHDVFTVFTQYGASTKRGSNVSVGMLGIGSKSGFAYSDAFSITSWHGGTKSIYNAILDDSDRGQVQLLHSGPSKEPTGVQIQIACRPQDVVEFNGKALDLYQHYTPQPQINITLPSEDTSALPHGCITEVGDDGAARWHVLMGCVPYRLDWNQMSTELQEAGLLEVARKLRGSLNIPIGDVAVSASREELKYTDATKVACVATLGKLAEEYTDRAVAALRGGKVTSWEQRLQALFLSNRLKIALPEEYKHLITGQVTLYSGTPKSYLLLHYGRATSSISVQSGARLVLHDDDRAEDGYALPTGAVLVTLRKGATVAEAKAELDEHLVAAKCEGIPIEMASTYTWYDNRKSHKSIQRATNVKHKKMCFKMVHRSDSTPYSKNWDTISRVPKDDDVFVIISDFRAVGHNIYRDLYDDEALAKMLGLKDWVLPEIYGYKTTSRKRVSAESVQGVEYRTWRKAWWASLMTPQLLKELRDYQWGVLAQPPRSYRHKYPEQLLRICKDLAADLGPQHPVTRWHTKHMKGKAASRGFTIGDRGRVFERVSEILSIPQKATAAEILKEKIYAAYPLMGVAVGRDDMGAFSPDVSYTKLVQYIKLVDRCAMLDKAAETVETENNKQTAADAARGDA